MLLEFKLQFCDLKDIKELNIKKYFNYLLILIFLIIIIILIIVILTFIWFEKDKQYQDWLDIFQKVKYSEQHYFMNYGLWNHDTRTLLEANQNLINLVYDKGNLKESKNILDVGCGYGDQDLIWVKNGIGGNITCMDLEQNSIMYMKNSIYKSD